MQWFNNKILIFGNKQPTYLITTEKPSINIHTLNNLRIGQLNINIKKDYL